MVDERTQHVWRQRAEDDDEVWLDILRVDTLPSRKGQAEGFQKTTYHLSWEDEVLPLEHPTRTTEMLEVANPEDDTQIVPVPAIKKYQSHNGDQKITHSFVNGEDVETRIYSVRRVYHRDTVAEPPVDAADYEVDPETIDEEQYIDVALIEAVVTTSGQGETFQKATHHYNTELIEQFSVPAPEGYDESKVVHLDPMQNIVNVQWGVGDNMIIAASFDVQILTYIGDGGWTARGILGTGVFEPIILDEGGDDENSLYPGDTYAATYSKAGRFFLFGGTFSELGGYEPIVDGTIVIRTEDGINWETVATVFEEIPGPGYCIRLLYNSIDGYVMANFAVALGGEDYHHTWMQSIDGRTWDTVTTPSVPFQKLPSPFAEITHGSVTDEEDVTRKIWLRRVEMDAAEVFGGTVYFPVSNEIDVAVAPEGPWSRVTTGVGRAGDPFLGWNYWQIAFGGGVAVICGGIKLAATRNGTTWTVVFDAAIFGGTGRVLSVAYLAGKFLMSFSGSSSGLYESSDGYTWTASATPEIPVYPFTAVPRYLLSGRVPDPDV